MKRSFRHFQDPAAAAELCDKLMEAGLAAEVWQDDEPADPLMTGGLPPTLHVVLPPEEMAAAERIMEQHADQELAAPQDPDYHLHSATDDELFDLLMRQDEWSVYDRQLAQRILAERGIPLPPRAVELMRASRDRELRAPAPAQTPFIVLGYILVLSGGLLAAVIGWYLNMSKKTLPNGERVPAYRPEDRRHGLYLFGLGLLSILAWSLVAVWRDLHGS